MARHPKKFSSKLILAIFKGDNFLLNLTSSCLLIIIFFIIIFSSLSTRSYSNSKVVLSYNTELKNRNLEDKIFELRPVLKSGVFSFPILSAQSVVVLDLDSNFYLYEKNSDSQMLPASLTKLVTAMVALDYFPLDKKLTFSGRYVEGQKMGLVKGESLTVEDALVALLVYSANDAAYLLAENYPGGVEAFVSAMNEKAVSLGANSTHFENPTGFDGGNHKTTALDLVRISRACLQNKKIMEIVSKKEVVLLGLSTGRQYFLKSTNRLLGEVDGVLGLKTGWTENARENLITYYWKDGKRLLLILLGSQDRFGETKELIDWILNSYDWLWVEVR